MIVNYDERSIDKFRPAFSKELIAKFGKGPFDTKVVTEALFFSLEWYTNQMLQILNKENELAFFQGLFILHEFSSELHRKQPNQSPIPQLSDLDFALYRRVLKLCLEQGCDIPLKSGTIITPKYIELKEDSIMDLLYLGNFSYMFSNLLANQHLIEDCVDLKFNEFDLFYFDHKHHYGLIVDEILKTIPNHLSKAVVDKGVFNEFVKAIKTCLNVEYDKAIGTIKEIHRHFEPQGGKIVLDEWFIYPKNLEVLFGIPYDKGEVFYKGLTLTRENKMPIQEAIYKPQNINRYLYRPFLVWNVDGKDLTIVGDGIFRESIGSLFSNSFGWGKYPAEWGNDCFKQFIKETVEKNDKVLEDAAEKMLKDNDIKYDRNIKNLKKWNNQNQNIDNEECGEIDFIFIYDKKIFIADSKHQTSRYDMNNFKNDYSSFDTGKKAYNKTLNKKLAFLSPKIKVIEEHFQVVLNDKNFVLDNFTMEGIFIVNTPTFIMYNNEFRIYTLKSFEELITGTFIDETYSFFIENEEEDLFLNVGYPYFKKPTYVVFKDEEED